MTYQCTGCDSEYVMPLVACPRCTAFGKEGKIVPKATTGGASNAHEPESAQPPVDEEPAADHAAGTEEDVPEDAGGQDPAGEADAAPARPAAAAPKVDWVAWAVACGLDQADAEAMKKAELQAWEPPAPGDPGAEPPLGGTVSEAQAADVAEAQVTHADGSTS